MPKDLSKAPKGPAAVDTSGFLQGTPETRVSSEQKLPRIIGHDAKLYLFHTPDLWELIKVGDEWELIPFVKAQEIRPGCNLVEQTKGTSPPKTGRMRAKMDDDGCILFTDTAQYLVKHESADGPRWFCRWDKIRAYPDGSWELHHDAEEYREFCRQLYKDGQIPPPRESVVNKMRGRLSKAIQRASKQPHLPAYQAAEKNARDRLDALDSAAKALADVGA